MGIFQDSGKKGCKCRIPGCVVLALQEMHQVFILGLTAWAYSDFWDFHLRALVFPIPQGQVVMDKLQMSGSVCQGNRFEMASEGRHVDCVPYIFAPLVSLLEVVFYVAAIYMIAHILINVLVVSSFINENGDCCGRKMLCRSYWVSSLVHVGRRCQAIDVDIELCIRR